jgi:streptomycin 6-kinase
MTGRPADDLRRGGGGRSPQGAVDGDQWLRSLPALSAHALQRWGLSVDGEPRHGECALVLPVRRGDEPAALKITWPHHEARTEHLALRHWAGNGAVRLLAADPASWSMLLERLDASRDLTREPIDVACAVIGDLLGQLLRPAVPTVPRLADQALELEAALSEVSPAVPRRFTEQARSLLRDLQPDAPGRGQGSGEERLLHTDLHFANVLAAARSPWLAIDPKPLAGDAAYEVAPALWNRWADATAGGDVRGHLRRRLSLICERAGIDEDRARSWTIVREVQNALYAVSRHDPDRVSVAMAIVKAMSG